MRSTLLLLLALSASALRAQPRHIEVGEAPAPFVGVLACTLTSPDRPTFLLQAWSDTAEVIWTLHTADSAKSAMCQYDRSTQVCTMVADGAAGAMDMHHEMMMKSDMREQWKAKATTTPLPDLSVMGQRCAGYSSSVEGMTVAVHVGHERPAPFPELLMTVPMLLLPEVPVMLAACDERMPMRMEFEGAVLEVTRIAHGPQPRPAFSTQGMVVEEMYAPSGPAPDDTIAYDAMVQEETPEEVEARDMGTPAEKALARHVRNEIRYPAMERENDVQGTVVVRCRFAKNGKLTSTDIAQGVPNGRGLEQEALRVVRTIPIELLTEVRGTERVDEMLIPVMFTLR